LKGEDQFTRGTIDADQDIEMWLITAMGFGIWFDSVRRRDVDFCLASGGA
jgi:hypothetical protein